MAVRWLARFAAGLRVPVFPAPGPGFADRVDDLRADPRLDLVASPRHATVLLRAGDVPEPARPALEAVHDQLPHPRVTLAWDRGGPGEPAAALERLHRELLAGQRPTEPDLLPDEDPHPWRGRGDFGQGGEGMMGGTPYGRPMAMTADDLRDGLALDAVSLTLGPFFPLLPAGLALRITLQGDVVQEAVVAGGPWPTRERDDDPFEQALVEPVPLRRLEQARAAHHLRQLARAVRLAGPGGLSIRLLRAAASAERDEPVAVAPLRRAVRRTGTLRAHRAGLGCWPPEVLERLGGPAARAAGFDRDARRDDPAYAALGFAPRRRREGDVRARLEQWLDEAEQSLDLARRAGDALVEPRRLVEAPEGERPAAGGAGLLERLLPGLEWGEALALIASCSWPARRDDEGEAA